jgi:RNA polymerase sigma factor for flagellar operon FliA
MATLSFSGKSSSSRSEPWLLLESGDLAWEEFGSYDKDKIVRHYAPKIKILALRLKSKLPQRVDLNELISAGTLGLMESLGKFKPELGIKFETYAENRIKGAMLDELRRMDWFSRGLRARVKKIEEAVQRIERLTGVAPSEEQLVKETGLTAKEVESGLGAIKNQVCISLDSMNDGFAGEKKLITENEPYQNAALQEIIEKVALLIEDLTPREQLVLSLYYTEELNMRETAEVMGITEGRVSQLHSQALGKLRVKFGAKYGLD